VRLIACPSCHTQYDVTHAREAKIRCRCGVELENRELEAIEARIHRCASCSAQVTASASQCDYCGSHIERDESKLSLVCPECYSRNANDARFCAACGVTFAPQPVEVQGEELPCPCCGGSMAVRELIGIPINECSGCNGLWVPGDELDFLISRAVAARERTAGDQADRVEPRRQGANPYRQTVQYRKCPKCAGMMARRNFRKTSGVIIDQCPEHGTWLDADEIEALAGFVRSGGRPRAEAFLRDLESTDQKQRSELAAMRARIESGRSAPEAEAGAGLLELLLDLLPPFSKTR